LRRQSTRAFLASTDVLAIVGKVEFAQFKQLVGSSATTGKGIKANNF
jgi:hypothetical protein